MSIRLDHVAMVVRNLEEGLERLEAALGLKADHFETLPAEGVRLAFLPVGEVRLELLEPLGSESPVGRFLERRGEGLHHLSFVVPDLQAALARCRERGITILEPAPRPGAYGARVAFLSPQSTSGVLIELVEGGERQ